MKCKERTVDTKLSEGNWMYGVHTRTHIDRKRRNDPRLKYSVLGVCQVYG